MRLLIGGVRVSAVPLWLLLAVSLHAQSSRLAIRGAAVVDVTDGSLRPDQVVLVEGRWIAALGSVAAVDIPADAQVVEAAGKYLIPGLWDMHVHSAVDAGRHFPVLLGYGVTGVRNMHSTVDTALALTTAIQRRLARGESLGPRFLANGPIVDGEPSVWPGAMVVRTAAEAKAAVDSLTDGGADFIKVYDNLTREAYFALARRAQHRGIPMVGHVPFRVRPQEAAEAGQRTDEHMIGLEHGCSTRADSVRVERGRLAELTAPFPEGLIASFRLDRALYDTRDPTLCAATIEVYRRRGMAVVPTLVIQHNNSHRNEVLSDPSIMRFVPAAIRRQWQAGASSGPGTVIASLMRPTAAARAHNVRLLKEGGVLILAGTDLGNPMLVAGISLHQELALLAEAGLTPLEAIQAATLNPARFLHARDSLGTVEAGKIADLVLLEANPLENIRNTRRINAVVVNGRLLDRTQLDQMLAEVARAAQQSK